MCACIALQGVWTHGERARMLAALGTVQPDNRPTNKFPKGFMEKVTEAVGTCPWQRHIDVLTDRVANDSLTV